MAAAASSHPPRRETVEFAPNIPITLSLAYSEPRMVSGQHGERAMFSTSDNRVLFLDPEVAGKITELGINVRESFTITRRSSGRKGQPDAWEVARIVGEQPNGTFAVPKLPDAAPAPKPPQRAANATGGAALVEDANALVDAFAEVLSRALDLHKGKVKPDEVKSIFLSVAISHAQKGRAA